MRVAGSICRATRATRWIPPGSPTRSDNLARSRRWGGIGDFAFWEEDFEKAGPDGVNQLAPVNSYVDEVVLGIVLLPECRRPQLPLRPPSATPPFLRWAAQHEWHHQSSTARPVLVTLRAHRHPWAMLINVESSSAGGATAPQRMQTFVCVSAKGRRLGEADIVSGTVESVQ